MAVFCMHAGVLPLLVDLRDYCIAEHTLVIRVRYTINIYFTHTVVYSGGCRGKYCTMQRMAFNAL